MRPKLRFASALSTATDLPQAIDEACRQVAQSLPGSADLVCLFLSWEGADAMQQLVSRVSDQLGTDQIIGCSAESVVGQGQEIELQPAVSIWAAQLPGVQVDLMHLTLEQSPEGAAIVGWSDSLQEPWPDSSAWIVLGEPFSFPMDVLLQRLNEDRPGVPVVGGMASLGQAPGENQLAAGRHCYSNGAVAVRLSGGLRMRTLVSQGCRPIGQPFVVTKAERNELYQLGGRPALAQLEEIFHCLPVHEQRMVQSGLHVGRVVSEYQDHFQQGDFLVRNVVGIQQDTGVIAVADYIRAGQTVQFQIRDQQTADIELQQMLKAVQNDSTFRPQAGLLFTCNGRGTRLFQDPHHDVGLVHQVLGDMPVSGCFAAGEIGPVGGLNFMHGFTASLVLFDSAEST